MNQRPYDTNQEILKTLCRIEELLQVTLAASTTQIKREAMFDVLEVQNEQLSDDEPELVMANEPNHVRLIAERLTRRSAEAIVEMAVFRESVDEFFFVTAKSGKYSDGDKYEYE